MKINLQLYNTISRQKEDFQPLNAPNVGLYVCGPTVYGDPHLGHARPAITFDLLFRFLTFLNYKVRYVRNITDVGHLEHDADQGEDKIAKKARLEQLEPMEVAQFYTRRYHAAMEMLNILPPSIEPQASGHIIEQIEIIKQILDAGYAYESEGSIYFDLQKFSKDFDYGKLSGRQIDEMLQNTRALEGTSEKRFPLDFALWKKASPEHIMRWPSPWSDGFPGWHLECTAMSQKYLGQEFDIHGGGMDLMFPHHECEIAQSTAAQGKPAVRYWMHNNMITINGQKMGKSLGNFITLAELFTGSHELLTSAFSPMTIRFFILQAQYRSTLDFSNEALSASEKGYRRLMEAMARLDKLQAKAEKSSEHLAAIQTLEKRTFDALADDLNSPVALSVLFDGLAMINSAYDGKLSLSQEEIDALKNLYKPCVYDILGLKDESAQADKMPMISSLVEYILSLRQDAKKSKDFAKADAVRDFLTSIGIEIKDKKDGSDWALK